MRFKKTLAPLRIITRLAQCALFRTLWPLFLINRIQDDRMRKKNPFPKYIRYECYLLQFFFSLKAAKPIDTALSKTSFHQFSKEIETTAPGP